MEIIEGYLHVSALMDFQMLQEHAKVSIIFIRSKIYNINFYL